MRSERFSAIILRRTNFGEADRIIEFLTPQGTVSAVAKGVRKQKSKLAGGIELFAVSDIVIRAGKGSLGTVTSARLITFYRHILEDYDRLQFGYDVLRLAKRSNNLSHEPDWYNVVQEVFAALDSSTIDLRLTKTWFYLRYADLMGYALGVDYDHSGAKLQQDKRYYYDSHERALRQSEKGELGAQHITLLRLAATKSLAVLARVGGLEDVLDETLYAAQMHAAVQ